MIRIKQGQSLYSQKYERMSASPIFSSAATSRHFIFPAAPALDLEERFGEEPPKKPAAKAAQMLAAVAGAPKLAGVMPASRLDVRPAPEMVLSGIARLDALTGGLARGCLTEICGTASSGRTSILLSALAQATQRGEVCALIDASDAFHPASGAAAGVELGRLLWVRCGEKTGQRKHRSDRAVERAKTSSHPNTSSGYKHFASSYQNMRVTGAKDSYHSMPSGVRHASVSYQGMPSGIPKAANHGRGFSRWQSPLGQLLKVTDLLLQSNGFGMIVLDLGDVPPESARRIPLASWFRFRRAVERTPTSLLVMEQQPIAGSCSSVILKISAAHAQKTRATQPKLAHTELLDQFAITAQVLGSRLERQSHRKPMQSAASFKSRAAWAG